MTPYPIGLILAGRRVLVVCGAAVLVLGVVTSGRWARGTAERTAEQLQSAEVREAAGIGA